MRNMSSVKFNIEGEVIDVPNNIIQISVLLRTTLDTNLHVDTDDNHVPIVEIITKRDIELLVDYYNNGNITADIIDAFDRLLVEPRITSLATLKYYWLDRICPVELRDKKIITTYIPEYPNRLSINNIKVETLEDIWKPVRRYQHYGILLNGVKKPEVYTLIPIDEHGPRGPVLLYYSKPSTNEQYTILDDICYNAYDTLKKYRGIYTHLLIISDIPKLYSIDKYIKQYVYPLHNY